MTIEQLKVLITAETSGLKKEIKKVESQLGQLDKTTQKATKSINNSFKSLFKGISVTALIAGLVKLGKTAVNTASALEEIQNVVDVSFGKASKEVDKFAENAIRQFGLSELSAKKFASTYMAMSNSLGVDADIGKTMALNLTGLVGDIASFYNISSEQANTAISAIYTGETESIKKLGIVLTEANLNAYAVSQGLKKTYNQMTQAEKVMLRYNYVMQASANIQGDFARTSGNWANQVRILKEQFSQLLSILGRGLIAVLNPVVKVMNNLLASLIAVANAMAKAFGGKGIESASGKVSSSVGDIADGAGDIGSGFDDANDSAKALAKTVAGFDELNVLNSPKDAGGSGDAGLGGDITGSGEVVEGPEMENPAGKLSDYLQQCKDIIDKWVSKIPKLEINFDKEKAIENLKSIGLNILNTIMGWGTFIVSIGIQVANDLDIGQLANDMLKFIDSLSGFISTFTDVVAPALGDFYRESGLQDIVQWIGSKLSESLQSSSSRLDEWAEWLSNNKDTVKDFGTRLGAVVTPLTNIVLELLKISWNVLASAISMIADAVEKIANNIVNLDAGQLALIRNLAVAFGALQVIGSIATPLVSFIAGLELATIKAGGAKNAFSALFEALNLKAGLKVFGKDWADTFTAGVSSIIKDLDKMVLIIPNAFKTAFSSIKGFFLGIEPNLQASFLQVKAVFTNLGAMIAEKGVLGTAITGLKTLLGNLGGAFKALWAIAKAHPFVAVITVITAVVVSITKLYHSSEEFRNFVSNLWDVLKSIIGEIGKSLKDLWDNHILPLWEELQPLFQAVGDAFGALWDTISTIIGWIVGVLGGTLLTGVTSAFKAVVNIITNAIASITDIIRGIIQLIKGIVNGDFQQIINGITNILQGLLSFITNTFKISWRVAWEGIIGVFRGLFSALPDTVKKPINSIIGFINGMLQAVVNGVNQVIRKINTLSWKVPDWVPVIGGQQWGFNFKTFTAYQIPYLANGGIITEPTVAMMGEYAGAHQNPEIVAPQNLLQQVIENSNNNVVDALIQQTRQLLSALENIDLDVSIGDEQIAKSAQRGNLAYKRRTGKPLFA